MAGRTLAADARRRSVPRSGSLVPAAARLTPASALSEREQDLNAAAIETFAKAVGGRDQLLDVLAVADTAPEVERLINLLVDPRYQSYGLRRLCTLAGLTVADLFAAYRKALIAQAHIQASHIIAARLPPVVADVMRRAVTHRIPCPACIRGKAVRSGRQCRKCHGTGSVRVEPEIARQKLALDLGQLLPRGHGLTIQQTQIAAGASAAPSAPGALEQLQQAVGELLFGSASQEGQVITEPEPPGEPARWQDPSPDPPEEQEEEPGDEQDDDDESDDPDDPDDPEQSRPH